MNTKYILLGALENCHVFECAKKLTVYDSVEDAERRAFDSLCEFYKGFDSIEDAHKGFDISWTNHFKNDGFEYVDPKTIKAYWCDNDNIFVSFNNCSCINIDSTSKRPAKVARSLYYGTNGGLTTDFNFAIIEYNLK